jgi:exopolysaccharide biosynthesis protein
MRFFTIIFSLALLLAPVAQAATVSQGNLFKLSGLNDFWYINPADSKRYYLSCADDYQVFLKRVSQPITLFDFQNISWPKFSYAGSSTIARKYAGLIVTEQGNKSAYWYINPLDLRRYNLSSNGLGVLKKIATTTSIDKLRNFNRGAKTQVLDNYSNYERKKVKTKLGEFVTDIVSADLSNPNLRIITDTADNHNCKTNCRARTVQSFIETNNAFAAMNGTYFDTSRAKLNYYFFPIFNSNSRKFINEDQLKYPTTGPLMVIDQNNKFYYFKSSYDFKSVANFEKTYKVKIQAAIGNKPRLIEDGLNYLIDWEVDKKQATVKTLRNAIAYKDNKLYFVVTQNSTVPDLAEVLTELGMQYAINIDGGYSTGLFYDGKMIAGPGRDVPNVIMFGYKRFTN